MQQAITQPKTLHTLNILIKQDSLTFFLNLQYLAIHEFLVYVQTQFLFNTEFNVILIAKIAGKQIVPHHLSFDNYSLSKYPSNQPGSF